MTGITVFILYLSVFVLYFATGDYTFYDSTEACYKFHAEKERGDEAEATCVREGGHLAVVNSQDEADFLVRNFPQYRSQVFLGFRWKNDSWVTIQGQNLTEAGYENWYYGEPGKPEKEMYGTEWCGTMFFSGDFNYMRCFRKNAFICEKEPELVRRNTATEVPTNFDTTDKDADTSGTEETSHTDSPNEHTSIEPHNECGTTDTEYTLHESKSNKKACYKLHPGRATWDDAKATCVREGGHLALPWTKEDGHFLYTLYADGWSQVFLGLRQKNGTLVTSQDQEVELVNPRNESDESEELGKDYCSSMNYHGDHDFINCSSKIGFICEKDPNSRPLPGATSEVLDEKDTSGEQLIESPAECGATDREYKLRNNTQLCYKFYTRQANWEEAQATCIRDGGYLAVGYSKGDKELFMKCLPAGFRVAWLNLNKTTTIPKVTDNPLSDHTLSLSYNGHFLKGLPRYGDKSNFICEKASNSASTATVITTEDQTNVAVTETGTHAEKLVSKNI